ncbi:hypothetical protein ACAW74_28390 [Fibrella sp. WM1]|uniref:hypothetical protein n=1 Tax=Fibrella musci TaxID=3242485 RepID=UPI003521241D
MNLRATSTRLILATLGLWIGFQGMLPWWSALLAAVLIGYATTTARAATGLIAALTIGLIWLATAVWHYAPSNGILTGRIGELLHVGGTPGVFVVVGALGMLLGFLGGMVGYETRLLTHLFSKPVTR